MVRGYLWRMAHEKDIFTSANERDQNQLGGIEDGIAYDAVI
jgi:hypothetical protein